MNRDLNDMDGGRCAKNQGKGGWPEEPAVAESPRGRRG